jgi:Fe-S oxidoreductase
MRNEGLTYYSTTKTQIKSNQVNTAVENYARQIPGWGICYFRQRLAMLNVLLIIIYTVLVFDFAYHIFAYARQISSAKHERRNTEFAHRIGQALRASFGHSRLISQWQGFAHGLIFYTFILFLPLNLVLFLERFGVDISLYAIFNPLLSLFAVQIVDFAALLCLCASITFMLRRSLSGQRTVSRFDAYAILWLIALLMLSHIGIIGVEARLGVAPQSAIAAAIAPIFAKLREQSLLELREHFVFWHLTFVALFLPIIARGKHLHIFAAPINIFAWNRGFLAKKKPQRSELAPDLEKFSADFEAALVQGLPDEDLPSLGVSEIGDFTWKQCLDAYSCAQCSRCSRVCPVNIANPPLDPMALHVSLRKLCQDAALGRKENQNDLVQKLVGAHGLWACTSCAACEEACPVGIEHIGKFVELKRNAVFTEQMPHKLSSCIQNIERNANPWGVPKQERAAAFDGYENTEGAEILIFAGCMASYDENEQRGLRAFLEILHKLGKPFSFLGENESCCGDPMRKLGAEANFQELAFHNIAAIKRSGAKCVVTACPHCAHALRHSYRDFDFDMPVFHALAWLHEEWKTGNLDFDKLEQETVVLHDACYLAKFDDVSQEIRELLKAVTGIILQEAKKHGRHAECCGAGGGQFWLDNNKQLAQARLEQLNETGATCLALSCPFCSSMFKSALMERQNLNAPTTSLKRSVNVLELLAQAAKLKRAPETKDEEPPTALPWHCSSFR